MRCCSNCEFNDGFIYTSMPLRYKCTVTNQYHFGNFDCNLEFVPVVRCRDCKRHENGPCANFKDDFYCAWGERRDDV